MSTISLTEQQVEAAAQAIKRVHYYAARRRASGRFFNQNDEFKMMAEDALAAALGVIPQKLEDE